MDLNTIPDRHWNGRCPGYSKSPGDDRFATSLTEGWRSYSLPLPSLLQHPTTYLPDQCRSGEYLRPVADHWSNASPSSESCIFGQRGCPGVGHQREFDQFVGMRTLHIVTIIRAACVP